MGSRGVLVALAVVALTVGACGGGGGSSLTAAQLRQRTNAQCRGLADAAGELDAASDPSVTGKAVTQHVHRAVVLLRARYRAIGALDAPDDLDETMERFVDLFERYAEELDDLGKQAKAGQVPIQSNPCDRFRCPARAAMLRPSTGTKTRKPQAAESPMPRQMDSASSIVSIRSSA